MKTLKKVEWLGSSLEDLKSFPDSVQKAVGYALHRSQEGKKHEKAKPLKGKHYSGVFEIVCPYINDTYRTVYIAKLGNKIYVLHAFMKKSKTGIKTPKPDLTIIDERLKQAKKLSKEEK
ncbi:type II toxin-antitoxin system RelE/ParE family toxin [bacterium]|nr:type II toxin-antitoxin system RelE/ParE family toxin [bacterium]